jgi:HAMP domain-containing protein
MRAAPADRISALEATVQELRQELADVRAEFGEFRKQFE